MKRAKQSQKLLNRLIQSGVDLGPYLLEDGIIGPKTINAFSKLENLLAPYIKTPPSLKNPVVAAIRMSDDLDNKFSDIMALYALKESGALLSALVPCSTKPSPVAEYTQRLYTVSGISGVAIMAEGYYHRIWKYSSGGWSGLPHWKQLLGPVTIYRDNMVNKRIDRSSPQQSGFFGINLHSWRGWASPVIGYWKDIKSGTGVSLSKGCQVVDADTLTDLLFFYKGKNLSYSLVHVSSLK